MNYKCTQNIHGMIDLVTHLPKLDSTPSSFFHTKESSDIISSIELASEGNNVTDDWVEHTPLLTNKSAEHLKIPPTISSK